MHDFASASASAACRVVPLVHARITDVGQQAATKLQRIHGERSISHTLAKSHTEKIPTLRKLRTG